jgi:D-alanyl-D-alanine carboxypeptidase/D-alanyl-D-alanine-endopeptidase (penicillin-binding protein 4)
MNSRFSRRLFLTSLAAFSASTALAAPLKQSLRPVARPLRSTTTGTLPAAQTLDHLLKKAKLGGSISCAVADPKTGKILEGRAANAVLPPASVTKAVTALYALHHLGPNHRFRTRLIATAPVKNGILKGDLVLAGGGDPTLNTDALAHLAKALKARGVREVRGRFLVYAGTLPYQAEIDPAQPDHVGYNPAISGLSLNFNRVHFEWKRQNQGWGISMDARSERYRPNVTVARMTVARRAAPLYTYQQKGTTDHWTVASQALGKGGSRWLPVRRPDLYAGEVFRTLARAHGIVLPAEKPSKNHPSGTTLASHESAALREILRGMLKYSTNLTAELVGLAATQSATGKRSTSLRASARDMSKWAARHLGMKQAKFQDHSGLGDGSRLSAQDMVAALSTPVARRELAPILKKIPMRTAKGKIDKTHPLNVIAKTGTLNFASSLAGYATNAQGQQVAFAIFSADNKRRSQLKKSERERPEGGRSWNKRAKRLQQSLLERWGGRYGK